MSRLVVSSDEHLGHDTVIKWRSFSTVEEHDDTIMAAHHRDIRKNDTWICLGDVAFTKEALLRLKEIKCKRKILILGNHCTERGLSIADYLEVFDEVHSIQARMSYGMKYLLSHCPIHPGEFRHNDVNIHGHKHEKFVKNPRYFNVCVEHLNWGVIPIEEIAKQYDKRKNSWLFKVKVFIGNLL